MNTWLTLSAPIPAGDTVGFERLAGLPTVTSTFCLNSDCARVFELCGQPESDLSSEQEGDDGIGRAAHGRYGMGTLPVVADPSSDLEKFKADLPKLDPDEQSGFAGRLIFSETQNG
ncbi:hypothetical protein GS610_13230 [Ruegeria sp. HKCCD6228]|uniref:hypothetical protein n=1 Tax=unclassified Ruegeria TaxID=2625375 RepID=UPI0014893772|nr:MULTISPECIES: hypothetical protein [unclassified Ruegeria]NOD98167.1 hypothetical protein [Ruegeria sp. HKCCD6228]